MEEHLQRIIECHKREAEDEFYRKVGDNPVYDKITWSNIESFLPRQGLILDAGGGSGVWSIKMAERRKCFIVLLDVTTDLLRTAKKKIKDGLCIEVLDADIRAIPHPEMSFDFVLCEADPICICGDPEKAVSELSRVLKPNSYLVAGVDSTLYRVFRALSQGKSLDYVLKFLQTGVAPAEEGALGALFESKSFTPTELITLLKKYDLETVKIVGKPIGFGPDMLDSFVSTLPAEKRERIFEDTTEKAKLAKILHKIYDEPYIAGIGSHLHIVAVKKTGSSHARA